MRDEDDFAWVVEAILRFEAVGARYGMNVDENPYAGWRYRLESPATQSECDDAEARLGIAFPPSLRRFYAAYDGADIGPFNIASVSELCKRTIAARQSDPQTYDEPVDDLLYAIDLFDVGERYVLSSTSRDENGEYPILFAFHEVGPSEWRASVAADSFGTWIREVFADVVERERWPLSKANLDESTFSKRYLYEAALAAEIAGDSEAARDRILRGISFRGLDPDSTYLTRAIALLRRLDDRHIGDAFLRKLLDYALAVEIAKLPGRLRAFSDRTALTARDFEERFHIAVPLELTGWMGRFGSITFFDGARYPSPYGSRHASFTLFGGRSRRGLRPATKTTGAPDGSLVIGEIGRYASLGYGLAYDEVLLFTDGSIHRSAFRSPQGGSPKSNPFAGPPIARVRGPIRLAENLDTFIDEAFANYLAGRPPYDLTD